MYTTGSIFLIFRFVFFSLTKAVINFLAFGQLFIKVFYCFKYIFSQMLSLLFFIYVICNFIILISSWYFWIFALEKVISDSQIDTREIIFNKIYHLLTHADNVDIIYKNKNNLMLTFRALEGAAKKRVNQQ